MKDIKCKSCGKIILYEDYKHELRAPEFRGIHCTHCGAEQLLEYQKIRGNGCKIVTKYQPPGGTKRFKIETHASCDSCYCYWEYHDEQVCPFCGVRLAKLDTVDYCSVPGVEKITEELKREQKKMQLKVDFMNLSGRISLLDFGKEKSDYIELKISMEQKNILSKLSELEAV